MCPIRFKKKKKKSALNKEEEAEEAKIIDNLLEQSLTYMPNKDDDEDDVDLKATSTLRSLNNSRNSSRNSSRILSQKNNGSRVIHSSQGTNKGIRNKLSRINISKNANHHNRRRRPKTASATLSSSSLNTSSIHSYKSSSTNRSRSTYNNNGNSESNNQQIRAFNITYQDGPMQDEDHGEDDVELLKHVLYREQCITDLKEVYQKHFKKCILP